MSYPFFNVAQYGCRFQLSVYLRVQVCRPVPAVLRR